ncbi:hypothetical protein RND81_09G033000 [Saponaria officinalis]|uniref:Malic enzyme NAD-binding domain-containing protein n=1 Tax=Saponaria officinalis TaxID=3572 RepID=A0AAW1IGX8_SAPOF
MTAVEAYSWSKVRYYLNFSNPCLVLVFGRTCPTQYITRSSNVYELRIISVTSHRGVHFLLAIVHLTLSNMKAFVPEQANNAYSFPGLRFGLVISGASRVHDEI